MQRRGFGSRCFRWIVNYAARHVPAHADRDAPPDGAAHDPVDGNPASCRHGPAGTDRPGAGARIPLLVDLTGVAPSPKPSDDEDAERPRQRTRPEAKRTKSRPTFDGLDDELGRAATARCHRPSRAALERGGRPQARRHAKHGVAAPLAARLARPTNSASSTATRPLEPWPSTSSPTSTTTATSTLELARGAFATSAAQATLDAGRASASHWSSSSTRPASGPRSRGMPAAAAHARHAPSRRPPAADPQHLDDLQHNRLPAIEKKTGYSARDDQGSDRGAPAASTAPRGRAVHATDTPYVVPDISSSPTSDGLRSVRLLDDQTPQLSISRHYQKLLKNKQADPEAREFIQKKIQSAQWLIESIEQRRNTLGEGDHARSSSIRRRSSTRARSTSSRSRCSRSPTRSAST